MGEYILIYKFEDESTMEDVVEYQFFDEESNMHTRVTNLAREQRQFTVLCAGRLARRWSYEAVQQPIAMEKVQVK